MAFSISHYLGDDVDYVGAKPYYDTNFGTISPPLGTRSVGNDGHARILVQASANIAANTAVLITEPAFTAAAGAGNYSSGAVAPTSGQYFWARANSI